MGGQNLIRPRPRADEARNRFDEARMILQTPINSYRTSVYIARAKLAVADSCYAADLALFLHAQRQLQVSHQSTSGSQFRRVSGRSEARRIPSMPLYFAKCSTHALGVLADPEFTGHALGRHHACH
jgi:hypothetical protein